MAKWRNHFSQLLNVHGITDVGQTEIHKAEPPVPEPSAFEVELAIEKLKSHRSPGIDHIPAEMYKARGRTIHSHIHELINSIWNKEGLPEEWKSITVPIYKKGDKTDCSNYKGISLSPAAHKILSNIQLSKLTPYAEEMMSIINVEFNAKCQLLIIYSAFVKYLRKNGNTIL